MVVSLLVFVRRCRGLRPAAGLYSSRMSMKRSKVLANFSSLRGEVLSSQNHERGFPMVIKAPAVALQLLRALAPSVFPGTRFCRSICSASVLSDNIQQPRPAGVWMCNRSGRRSADAPVDAGQLRRMSEGNVVLSLMELLHVNGSESLVPIVISFGLRSPTPFLFLSKYCADSVCMIYRQLYCNSRLMISFAS